MTACGQNRNGLRWSIPTKHLNALWTGLWPRMAARIWLDPALQWPDPFDPSGDHRDIGRDLQVWIESFLGRAAVTNPVSVPNELGANDPDIGPQSLVDSGGAPHSTAGSSGFQSALEELHAYLGVPVAHGRAPIYLIGRGGYDFLLSEKGVELWAPPDVGSGSAARAKLLDAYEYRRTGRPPLAIGYVMEGAVGFPDAPTGPGQIDAPVDIRLLKHLCLDPTHAFRYCGVREGARDWVRALPGRKCSRDELADEIRAALGALGAPPVDVQRVVASDDPIEEAAGWIETAEAEAREGRGGQAPDPGHGQGRDRSGNDSRGGKGQGGKGQGEEGQQGVREAREDECIPLSADLYYCHTLTRRCWVVSGTVFRGVLEQFPRAVADHWSDDPGADLKAMDVREECEERLEVALPAGMRFEFQDAPGAPSDPLGIRGNGELWEARHLMVTNTGFLFPAEIGYTDGSGDCVARNRDDLLTAIITGRAGNPVFTDSSACM